MPTTQETQPDMYLQFLPSPSHCSVISKALAKEAFQTQLLWEYKQMKFRVPQFWHWYCDKYTVFTVGIIKICALVFRGLQILGCINLKKFIWFWAKLWHFQKSFGFLYLNLRLKLLWQFFYFLFIAITWPNFINWECFGIPKTSSDNGSIIFYVKIEEP